MAIIQIAQVQTAIKGIEDEKTRAAMITLLTFIGDVEKRVSTLEKEMRGMKKQMYDVIGRMAA